MTIGNFIDIVNNPPEPLKKCFIMDAKEPNRYLKISQRGLQELIKTNNFTFEIINEIVNESIRGADTFNSLLAFKVREKEMAITSYFFFNHDNIFLSKEELYQEMEKKYRQSFTAKPFQNFEKRYRDIVLNMLDSGIVDIPTHIQRLVNFNEEMKNFNPTEVILIEGDE